MSPRRARRPQARRLAGFTLIELMVVIGVLAILALLTLPSLRARLARQSIAEAAALADTAKAHVAAAWTRDGRMPADNEAAGLPAPDKMVGNVVATVTVEQGAVHLRFSQRAHAPLKGRVLSFRPATVPDAPVVPIAWVCGPAPVPDRMAAQGRDLTDVPDDVLPLNCRRR